MACAHSVQDALQIALHLALTIHEEHMQQQHLKQQQQQLEQGGGTVSKRGRGEVGEGGSLGETEPGEPPKKKKKKKNRSSGEGIEVTNEVIGGDVSGANGQQTGCHLLLGLIYAGEPDLLTVSRTCLPSTL
jgi:hypothetical protein